VKQGKPTAHGTGWGLGTKNGVGLQSSDGKVVKRKQNSLWEDAGTPAQSLRWYKPAQHYRAQLGTAPDWVTCSQCCVLRRRRSLGTAERLQYRRSYTYLSGVGGKQPHRHRNFSVQLSRNLKRKNALILLSPRKVLPALMRQTEPECTVLEGTLGYLLEKGTL